VSQPHAVVRPLPDVPYVVTLGETMALMGADEVGPLAHASSLRLGMGGSESNVAIGLQRLGVQAVWCSRLGDDSFGELVAREVRAEQVDVRAVVDPGAPTGLMVKERRTAVSQRVTYYRAGSAASRMTPDDVDPRLIAGAAVLHVSGITAAISPTAAAALRHAVAVARDAGVTVSFDLNHRSSLWSDADARALYREVVPLADVVFGGLEEAALAVGEPGETGEAFDAETAARRLVALGAGQAVVKLGAEGALALVDGAVHRRAAIPVPVVDTVGAGDAFVAGYLAELVEGRGVDDRLATAVATGAFACMVPSDWEGLPRRRDLALLGATEPVQR
jgi:2-dehydro-3-deoxygluconokinase